MRLEAGARIGPYEILAALGAGGMGEVFRARDTRLNRDVAVKVLPELFTRDPDRLARFTREAQALAALNHPNIAQIYGVVDLPPESGSHATALVMELVEGEDLSAIIAGGPVPLTEAQSIAGQIADALEAAHDHGIIHRDLKPANIKVRPDGTVKVLDFGLAKVVDPLASGADAMHSPTFTSPAMTAQGVILGTAAYMSPEQARGKTADARADLWAFGVILYEMLTGRRLFDGAHASEVLAAVLRDGPNWDALPADTPPGVRRVLSRCLQKDPKMRMRHAGDARLELADADSHAVPIPAAPVRRPRSPALAALAGVLVLAALGAAFVAGRRLAPAADVRVGKWIVPQESGDQEDAWARENTPALSRDGRHLAYVDGSRLMIRGLASLVSRVVDVKGVPGMPVWSPDSAHVAFFVDGLAIWRAPRDGGPPTKICDIPAGVVTGMVWRSDRTILVNVAYGPRSGEIFKVNETGGPPEKWPVPGAPSGETSLLFNLRGLPDGTLVYSVNPGSGPVRMLQRGGDPPRELAVPFTSPVTYSNGHLLWSQSGSARGIFAVPFDLAQGAVAGEPFRVADSGVSPSASEDGTLAYGLPRPGLRQLAWVERDGTPGALIGQPQDSMWGPAISPDGARVAVAGVEDGRTSIWTHEIARGAKNRVTLSNEVALEPTWHPSDGRIVFQTGGWNLNAVSAEGGEATPIVRGPEPEYTPSWSRDGRYLVFGRFGTETKGDIWMLEAGAAAPKPVFTTPFPEEAPALSPDGRYIAYVSHETGRAEVFIRTFPGGQGKTQVSFGGGTTPRWNPRGGEIFFVESRVLMAAPVRTAPALGVDAPKRLFDLEDRDLSLRQYDTADGRRFVVVRTIRPSRNGIAVVQNWAKEFAR